MGNFIDPRADWAFKRIFGSDDTKECLITFLNGLFKGELIIKDVKFEKTEQAKEREEERGVIFDVKCTTSDGRHIIVEMQKKEQEYFVDRAIFYTAKAIVGQGKKGRWDFHLAPVYTICFMNFIAEEGCEDDIFKCWIYILRNMGNLERMPFIDKYPVFRKLAYISDLTKLTPEEQEKYEEDIKIMRDLYATRKFELKRRKIERAEGITEGQKLEKIETAKRLVSMGFLPEQIVQCTQLPMDEVMRICQENNQ